MADADADLTTSASNAFVAGFPASTFALHEGSLSAAMARTKVDPAAAKRLLRAKMLHNVITAKLPQLKLEDLRKMSVEWVLGLLDATFPLETALVDANCSDRASLDTLLAALDGAHDIGVQLGMLHDEATKASGAAEETSRSGDGDSSAAGVEEASCSSGESPGRVTQAQAAEMLQNAVAAGAKLMDVVPGSAPEAHALGYELWEALCWRRGALRYYMIATAVNASLGKAKARADGDAAATNARAGAAAAASASLIDASHAALNLLLAARSERTDLEEGTPPVSTAHMATALRYGIYSTTHLLSLAFDAELCYWKWAAEGQGASAGAPAVNAGAAAAPAADAPVDVSEAPADASAASEGVVDSPRSAKEVWYQRACVRAHRYLHTVEVLMEGCGWDVTRTRDLLRLLSTGRVAEAEGALQGEEGVTRQMEALKMSVAGGGGEGAPAGAGGGKKGKAGKARA